MEERHVLRVRRRLAAPAPPSPDRPWTRGLPAEVEAACWQWARWVETRRLYAPNPKLQCVIGRLRTSRSTAPAGGRDAVNSALMQRFHQAVTAEDDLHRLAFEGYFLLRVSPVKKLAAVLGVDRTHVYWLRRQVALRAYRRMQDG